MILIGETVTEELWRSLGQSRETQLKRASGVISRGWGLWRTQDFNRSVEWRKLGVSWRNTAEQAE